MAAAVAVQVLTCRRCGMQWERRPKSGPRPRECGQCAPGPPPAERLALAVTDYRLAIELATAALRLGRPRAALQHLEAVQAPTRHT